jgi:7-cyano-7-deazaguanine synthase
MTIAYVLLSGGIDSSTCVSEAKEAVGQRNVRCVSIDYGQRHVRELESARHVSGFYGRAHKVINMQIAEKTMLTDRSIEVPNISYSEIQGVSPTYVPFRNGMMLSRLAAYIAEQHFDPSKATLSADSTIPGDKVPNPEYMKDCLLYFGAHAEDAANWAYPDCTPEFVGAMANAIYVGTYHKLRLVTPFIHSTKAQIIKRGKELGTPYYLTWSCYKGGVLHCGTCATCLARKEAFDTAGVEDPTQYEEPRPKHALGQDAADLQPSPASIV